MLQRTDTHEYYNDGVKYWGVTEVIRRCGFIHNSGPEYLERGDIVHRCCALLARQETDWLDWSTVDDRIVGYVLSYQALLDTTGWVANLTEQLVGDDRLKLAGTYDLTTKDNILADLKTGHYQKWHQMQLGAYWHLSGERPDTYGIYLQQDGSIAKLKRFVGRQGWLDFLACLNYLNVQERYK